jgi:pimeloyl-ACP methyl ester carboxylesterase
MSSLAEQGYRVVAPYLRGYPPTEIPEGGYFDKATHVADVVALIQALNGGKPCYLIGQDWGAIIGYGLLAAHPELVSRAVLMAVPHPGQVTKSLLDPKHIHRSFHWWFFQLADLPEKALLENDMAFIDYLWTYWTTEGYQDADHIRSVKDTLKQPGVLTATLAYYRAMFDHSKADPALSALREAMARPITVPTMTLCGADDLRAELMQDQSQYFLSEYAFKLIDRAGHFLHREQPGAVSQEIIEWFKK